MFKVKSIYTEHEATVYATKEDNGIMKFLIYNSEELEWEWILASDYKPLEE